MKPLVTVAQVATALNVHRSVAYREVKAHMVHVVVGQGAIRVPQESLDAYIRSKTKEPTCPRSAAVTGSTARRSRTGRSYPFSESRG